MRKLKLRYDVISKLNMSVRHTELRRDLHTVAETLAWKHTN